MDIQNILGDLKKERERLDRAITALEGLGSGPRRRGRPVGSHNVTSAKRPRRHMSAAARKRISAAMKQRWAKWKGKSAPKRLALVAKKSAGRKPMSPAMKKKLSAMMKARWAEKKKATQTA